MITLHENDLVEFVQDVEGYDPFHDGPLEITCGERGLIVKIAYSERDATAYTISVYSADNYVPKCFATVHRESLRGVN